MLGSQSGITPGTPVGSFLLPLNKDPYFDVLLSNPNPAWMPTSQSFTSVFGHGSISFVVPAGAPVNLVGTTIHHACVLFDWTATGQGTGDVLLTSNPVGLLFTP
jgi:hypothetical protein